MFPFLYCCLSIGRLTDDFPRVFDGLSSATLPTHCPLAASWLLCSDANERNFAIECAYIDMYGLMDDGKECFAIPNPFIRPFTHHLVSRTLLATKAATGRPYLLYRHFNAGMDHPLFSLLSSDASYSSNNVRRSWGTEGASGPFMPLADNHQVGQLCDVQNMSPREPRTPVYWCSGWSWTGVIAGQLHPTLPFPLNDLQEHGNPLTYSSH